MNFQLRPALVLFALLSLLTGLAYPLAVTGIAQLLFRAQANGSLIVRDARSSGRRWSARPSPIRALLGRPSATCHAFTTPPTSSGRTSGR